MQAIELEVPAPTGAPTPVGGRPVPRTAVDAVLDDVEAVLLLLGEPGDHRPAMARSVVEVLAGEERVAVLRRRRAECQRLVAGAPDVAHELVGRVRRCHPSCRARQFWIGVIADAHGSRFVFPLPPP